MKYAYLLLFFLCLGTSVRAAELRGFLLTKDGYQLTGYLERIQYSPTGNEIRFVNDFGDTYIIHPFLVSGFGFTHEGTSYRFVSRFHEGQWFFLQEKADGRTLRLYRLPESSDSWVDDSLLRLFTVPPPTFYLEYGRGQLMGVPRTGFRRAMREFFNVVSPAMAKKVGTKGYRYRDLALIVAEVNEMSARQRRRL